MLPFLKLELGEDDLSFLFFFFKNCSSTEMFSIKKKLQRSPIVPLPKKKKIHFTRPNYFIRLLNTLNFFWLILYPKLLKPA